MSDQSAASHQSMPPPASGARESVDSPQRARIIERTIKSIWDFFHLRFPRLVPPSCRDDRDYLRHRDAEDNLESRIPSDEILQQAAIWGVEIFGPAEVDGLHLALDRLGWNEDRFFGFGNAPSSWINEQRTYGTEGNLNLGVIERSGKSRFLPRGRSAPLPEAIDYAHGYVYQLSPSITAVVLCFILTDSVSHAYNVELGLDRRTEHEPFDGGVRMYGVKDIKRRAVDLVRTKSRALVVEWFATHLPGQFSRAPDGNRLPTAELITTAHQPLFAETAAQRGYEPDWVRLMSPHGFRDVWKLNEFDGLTLCWPDSEGDLRYHGIFNLQTDLLTNLVAYDDDLNHRGEEGNAAHARFVSDKVEGILVNFAAIAALQEIVRLLRITPGALSADTTSRRGTVKCLEQIRLFFDRSVGIPAFTSELATKSEEIHSYKWGCVKFHTIPWCPEDQSVEISEVLRSRTHFLASRSLTLEKETREHLEQLSAILSTRENIRTQARMELVAIGAAILSLASLAVAVMSVDRFASYVNQQIEKLYTPKETAERSPISLNTLLPHPAPRKSSKIRSS